MIPTSVLIKLATLGLSEQQAEAIGVMLSQVETATREASEAVLEKSREKARARLQKWKDKQPNNVSKRSATAPNVSQRLTRVEGSSSKEEISGEVSKEERNARDARSPVQVWFSEFWNLYPNKVGRRDAEKAFTKARMRASPPDIIAGLLRYVAKTDDRPWCNPATWLNQDRWDDQPAATVARVSTGPPEKNPLAGYERIARKRGWIDEPNGIPGTDHDAGELSRHGQPRHAGTEIIEFRGGIGGRYR